MKIDIRSKDCLYVEINGYVYYIDDSTNEQIIECNKELDSYVWIENRQTKKK